MTQQIVATPTQAHLLEQVLVKGDLSKLSDEQKVMHLKTVCDSLGLNALTRPFEYITLNGKLTLYAKRDATDQLRKINKVSVKIVSRELVGELYVVTAQATLPDGRTDESIGAVNMGSLKGDARANQIMKAETKAKRRVTLSICGLGFLDETEVETITQAPAPAAPLKELGTPKADWCGDYTLQIGKNKGKKIKDVDPKVLFNLANYLDQEQKKAPLKGFAKETLTTVTEYLDELREEEREASDASGFEENPFPFEEK